MEAAILMLLQSAPGAPYTLKEIGRKVDRDMFRQNPNWARPYLENLLIQGVIALDPSGYYFFPVPAERD